MSLINWRRGDLLPSFSSMVENFFDNDNDFEKWWKGAKTVPAVNVVETDKSFDMEVAAPGMKKEDIDVSLHEGTLTVSGERKSEREEKDGETFRSERFYGRFQRSVLLPTKVAADKVNASYKDGILTVTLPKTEEAKPKQIQVSVD